MLTVWRKTTTAKNTCARDNPMVTRGNCPATLESVSLLQSEQRNSQTPKPFVKKSRTNFTKNPRIITNSRDHHKKNVHEMLNTMLTSVEAVTNVINV